MIFVTDVSQTVKLTDFGDPLATTIKGKFDREIHVPVRVTCKKFNFHLSFIYSLLGIMHLGRDLQNNPL